MSSIREPARELPVWSTYDVVVAGGGIAGVAAAVAAAREGVSVALIDKAFALGGLATLGNVTVYLPICDGRGRQVIGGLAEELLKLSVADLGPDRPGPCFRGIPPCWQQPDGDPEERAAHRYATRFNPAGYLLALEKLVVDSGVQLYYDTRICAVHGDGRRLSHLVVENKSGRGALAAGVVVDATGDADLCAFAGEATQSLDSNVLCGWFYYLAGDELRLHCLSNRFSKTGNREEVEGPAYRGDDGRQVTAHLLGSRQLLRDRLDQWRREQPDTDFQVILPPTFPGFRMTRRLAAEFALDEAHMHQWFDDTVCLTGDWRRAGPVFAIPLRALRAPRHVNLLTAGRCISATPAAWDFTRAIPTCAATGEAAGAAAAIAARHHGGNLEALPVAELQARLRQRGNRLDPALAKPAP